MYKKVLLVTVVFGLLTILFAACTIRDSSQAAAGPAVHMGGADFLQKSVTIKKGESVTFVNDDTVPHNIVSTSAGNEFNLGSQPPGAATDVTFKQAGDVQVICAIHPRMKMTVQVTD